MNDLPVIKSFACEGNVSEHLGSDTSWIRKAFGLDFVGPTRPMPKDESIERLFRRAPLRTVIDLMPMSDLGSTLLSLELEAAEWQTLAAGPLLAETVSRWDAMVRSVRLVVGPNVAFLGRHVEFSKNFKTLDEFKKSSHFKSLTSEFSLEEVFKVHDLSDKDRLDLIFPNAQDSPASRKLKKQILALVRDSKRRDGVVVDSVVIVMLLTLLLSYLNKTAETVVNVDSAIGVICKYIPVSTTDGNILTSICRKQKEGQAKRATGGYIRRDSVYLRGGPSKSELALVKMRKYDQFWLLDDPEEGWIKIKIFKDGVPLEGWVYKPFAMFW